MAPKVVALALLAGLRQIRAVEEVIGISTEVDLLLMPDGEVLGDGRTIGLEAGCTLRADGGVTEGTGGRLTVGADTVVDTRRRCRGWPTGRFRTSC